LKVADQKSKNGTYFEGKRQRKPFEVSPGKTFFVGARSHQLVALNAQMWTHYDELAAILGYEDEHVIRSETPSPSDLIVAAVNGPHILITSEPNCEQARLAHIVHEISQLHERPLVAVDHPEEGLQAQIDLIEHRAATVLLDLGDNDIRLDPTFVSRLFSTRYQTRVIALARTVDVASRALGERHVKRMKHVWLEPLSGRKIAILRLMDRMFRKHGSSLRVQALPTHNQAALRNHQWEKNFASLEDVAERLIVILREPSLRKAAAVLGLHHNTLQNWHTNIMGMELPSHDESER
jgi:hypothetical protein